MRIVHIIWGLGIGGAETMLVDIVNEQVKSESVAIAIVNDTINESLLHKLDKRCKVWQFDRKIGSKNLLPWIKLNIRLFRYRPDIIHFHLEGMRKMVFHPAPKVFTIHNTHTSGNEYPRFQALFAISDGVKAYTQKQGFESTTIWNGIKPEQIKEKARGEYLVGGVCKIVCIGRLFTPHKGQDILVEALGKLKKQGNSDFHLDIIGEGESRVYLENLIHQRGLDGCVSLLGQRSRDYIYEHLCDYDLFVLPSRSEGFGLSVAEAMCAKIPVLVSNLEGVLDVIDGGRLGITFESGNADSLSERLLGFLTKGKNESQIEEAFRFAREEFDICRTAKGYIIEYGEVIESYKA